MCGILCCLTSTKSNQFKSIKVSSSSSGLPVQEEVTVPVCPFCVNETEKQGELRLLQQLLSNRGPDISSEQCLQLENTWSSPIPLQIHLAGYVLWTQGDKPLKQPIFSEDLSKFLLFNGDIYSFGNESEVDHQLTNSVPEANDGERLFNILTKYSSSSASITNFQSQAQYFMEAVSKLEGPIAFMFYDKSTEQLWFYRDVFGRQSLLISTVGNQSLIFSSVSTLPNSLEIPASGLYCYNLATNEIRLYPWNCHERVQITEYTAKLGNYLEGIGIRFLVDTENRIEIGKDLTIKLKPPPCDPESNVILKNLMAIDSTSLDLKQTLQQVTEILDDKIDQLLVHLRRSIRRRIFTKPSFCKKCLQYRNTEAVNINSCSHSKIGILFSGGLDSMVLTYLSAELLASSTETNERSVDLINVAFFHDEHYHKLQLQANNNASAKIPIPPDRQTGQEAYELLNKIFKPQGIQLNFIPVNVSKSRVQSVRETKLRHLISPLTSVLDDSVGCCLWFATEATSNGLSNARILLLGSGADEIFGGYGRHRSAFESKGWTGLLNEMQLEIDRISIRNLGRDNRVLSDHSISPRLPFLDEYVVRFVVQECDLWEKCCPLKAFTNNNNNTNGQSLGDKILLRATAMKLLSSSGGSLENSDDGAHLALFAKRAMQFGSRIAKLENSKEKGGDQCKRLVDS